MADTNRTPEDLRSSNSEATWEDGKSPAPWIALEPDNSFFVSSLGAVKDNLVPVVEAAKTILQLVKTLLQAALNLIGVAADAAAAALQAAIDAVRAILEDLLNAGTFYTLVVPIGRTDITDAPKIIVDSVLGGNPFPEELPISGEDLLGSGGNYGFLNTVAASLEDAKDPNRPRFSQDAHIAAGVIVFGSTNLYELRKAFAKLLKALKIPGSKSSFGGSSLPNGLRATIVPSSYGTAFGGEDEDNIVGSPDSDHPYAVKLEWNLVDTTVNIDSDGNREYIKRVVFYRATDPDVLSAAQTPKKWEEFELASMTFDELTKEFFDNTIEAGKVYTYGVGFELAVENTDEVEVVEPFVESIRTARISTENIRMSTSRGVPPDWGAYNILDMLFPEARQFVEQYLFKFLDSLEDSLANAKEALEEFIEFLEGEIKRYSSWVQNVLNTIQELIEALTWPNIYAGATLIYSDATLQGGGGNRFFINQLAKALTDEADSNRPPFDRGNEAVAGLVLLAGSESAGAVSRAKTFLETFLGSAESNLDSNIQQALDSINYLTEQAQEQLCLSPALDSIVCEGTEETGESFDHQFEPANEAAECGGDET